MTYYLVNENTDEIIEGSPDRPSRAELLDAAKYFKCPIYLIEGQRVGYTASPPEPEIAPAPLPVDDGMSVEELDLEDVLAMLSRDDHAEMATWLTEQIGENVHHHPIENLRIFMERQIHNLEAGL